MYRIPNEKLRSDDQGILIDFELRMVMRVARAYIWVARTEENICSRYFV